MTGWTRLFGAEVFAPEPLGVVDVWLAGGRVVAIVPRGSVSVVGADVTEVDLTGLRLCPGFIDAHAHLTGGGGEGGAHTRVPAVPLTAFTTAGVTTAIGLLGTDCETRSIQENLACARALSQEGLTALCYTGGYAVPPRTLTGSVRGDIVHVDRIVAVGEVAISDHRSSQPTFDEILRLAAEAHVAGMMTGKAGLLHLHLGDGARGLEFLWRARREAELPVRTFHPTHVNRNAALAEESLRWVVEGGYADVTAFDDDASAVGWLVDAHARGVGLSRVTLSSDAGGCLPTFDGDGVLVGMGVGTSSTLAPTLAAACEAGVAVEDALALVTRNVATLFRLAGKGRVVVGGDADLVALDAAWRPVHVWARGRPMVVGGVAVERGTFESVPLASSVVVR